MFTRCLTPLVIFSTVVCLPTVVAPVHSEDDTAGSQPEPFERVSTSEDAHLHNVIAVSDRLLSGSDARGPAAFAELKRMGVSTVVSVDGATPDIESARSAGIRYVHIPVRYDGIDRDAQLALYRVMREVDGLIYVHCHHGTHRGPAAAAICALVEESIDTQGAAEFLKQAGTGADYVGLWRDVAEYTRPAEGVDLPALTETATVDSMTSAMARAGRLKDELSEFRNRTWAPDPDQSDRTADRVALLLSEELRESGRNLAAGYGEDFEAMMAEAADLAADLRLQLQAGQLAAADERLTAVRKSCINCHEQYRN